MCLASSLEFILRISKISAIASNMCVAIGILMYPCKVPMYTIHCIDILDIDIYRYI